MTHVSWAQPRVLWKKAKHLDLDLDANAVYRDPQKIKITKRNPID
jgi:hypothetical protein